MTETDETPWWAYDQLESSAPYDWHPAARGDSKFDKIDFHLDLGCGTLKKGRLGIDRYWSPGVDLAINFETLQPADLGERFGPEGRECSEKTKGLYQTLTPPGSKDFYNPPGCLPFPDDSIESIISHHMMEHLGDGFVPLMDECHRVLKPGGILRIITPLFPSASAVADPDHRRYFMSGTFETFCGAPDGSHWMESFSVPYTSCRFEMVDKDMTGPAAHHLQWTDQDAREIRVALRKYPR